MFLEPRDSHLQVRSYGLVFSREVSKRAEFTAPLPVSTSEAFELTSNLYCEKKLPLGVILLTANLTTPAGAAASWCSCITRTQKLYSYRL
jgi:hypothetical protein